MSNWLQFFGFESAQHKAALGFFNSLLNDNKFDVIIELGTGRGGLTTILGLYALSCNAKVYTFDRHISKYPEALQQLKVSVNIVDNLFNNKNMQIVQDLIKSSNKQCLLLCDNGDKVKEFKIFSPHLKSGDVILAHDYGYDKESFKKTGWKSCEIVFSDIAKVAECCDLELYMQDESEKAVWLCMKKI